MNVNKCLVSLSQPSERLLMISWRKEKKEIIAEVTCPNWHLTIANDLLHQQQHGTWMGRSWEWPITSKFQDDSCWKTGHRAPGASLWGQVSHRIDFVCSWIGTWSRYLNLFELVMFFSGLWMWGSAAVTTVPVMAWGPTEPCWLLPVLGSLGPGSRVRSVMMRWSVQSVTFIKY